MGQVGVYKQLTALHGIHAADVLRGLALPFPPPQRPTRTALQLVWSKTVLNMLVGRRCMLSVSSPREGGGDYNWS